MVIDICSIQFFNNFIQISSSEEEFVKLIRILNIEHLFRFILLKNANYIAHINIEMVEYMFSFFPSIAFNDIS